MSFCKDCVRGVRWEGTPTGKMEKINGVDCYVATPEGDYPKDKVLLLLTDVFGLPLVNNKLLADDYAANGFKTVVPDFLNGDPVPADGLSPGSNFDLMKWFPGHGADQTRPPIDKVMAALKEQGVTAFGAVGYCFGARYVFDLAFDNAIKAAAVAHPSLLQMPADAEKYAQTSVPLLVESCETDSQLPPEKQVVLDEILGGGKAESAASEGKAESAAGEGKFAAAYKRAYWEGCTHGFAVRGDQSDPKVKAGKEGAFKDMVEWMQKYL
ncbi:Alpha/Beta hydrolase protein [Schizophyllum amplum]|uniref:Alpha/Beta hydrolase protein n=1 Tax=Schizophyllum amplum TaxID=97359 RepID=A0A550CJ57_9AGAR|nr:Alpha/Beta hydrolase protein [Auriculariopsis ampla]